MLSLLRYLQIVGLEINLQFPQMKRVGFSASLTELTQSCREFLWLASFLLHLTTQVVSYLRRCKRLFTTHEFFKVCKNMSFHSVCTLSVLQSQVFGLRLSYCILYPTLLAIFSYKRKVHSNNVDDVKAFRYVQIACRILTYFLSYANLFLNYFLSSANHSALFLVGVQYGRMRMSIAISHIFETIIFWQGNF